MSTDTTPGAVERWLCEREINSMDSEQRWQAALAFARAHDAADADLRAALRDAEAALEFTETQIPLGHYHGPFGYCVPCKIDAALARIREVNR